MLKEGKYRAHGRLDGIEKRLNGIEGVLISIAKHLGVDVDYLPESKVIDLNSRRQEG